MMVRPNTGEVAPHGVELRHLRYFVAVADAGTFTQAAERMFISQPTISQQIRRLEELHGAPLLQRGREGVRLTDAGSVLLWHAGSLAAATVAGLRGITADAGVDAVWLERVPRHRVLAHRAAPCRRVPRLGRPGRPGAARVIGLRELTRLAVVYGRRRVFPGIYDPWLASLRSADSRFEFADPPFRQSFPLTLDFAAAASRPTAVLTGPRHLAGEPAWEGRTAVGCEMVRVRLDQAPLNAKAALVWNGDLPRQLQQILFDAADGVSLRA